MTEKSEKRDVRELNEKELKQVYGGKSSGWTTANPGGQPHGASQKTYNPGGNAPPGKNKDLPPGQQ